MDARESAMAYSFVEWICYVGAIVVVLWMFFWSPNGVSIDDAARHSAREQLISQLRKCQESVRTGEKIDTELENLNRAFMEYSRDFGESDPSYSTLVQPCRDFLLFRSLHISSVAADLSVLERVQTDIESRFPETKPEQGLAAKRAAAARRLIAMQLPIQ